MDFMQSLPLLLHLSPIEIGALVQATYHGLMTENVVLSVLLPCHQTYSRTITTSVSWPVPVASV